MELSTEQIRQWRDEASENIERIDNGRGRTPGAEHINSLLRPREARILTLCEALLDSYDKIVRGGGPKPDHGQANEDRPAHPWPYPADEPDVIDLGDRHFVLPVGLDGYLWHHDGPHRSCHSWGWFGARDGRESGHRIVSHDPLTVEGSLIHEDCGDHGFIRGGRWVKA